jgi:hypothetical protein
MKEIILCGILMAHLPLFSLNKASLCRMKHLKFVHYNLYIEIKLDLYIDH